MYVVSKYFTILWKWLCFSIIVDCHLNVTKIFFNIFDFQGGGRKYFQGFFLLQNITSIHFRSNASIFIGKTEFVDLLVWPHLLYRTVNRKLYFLDLIWADLQGLKIIKILFPKLIFYVHYGISGCGVFKRGIKN